MIELQLSGPSALRVPPLGAAVSNGMLALVHGRSDLDQLVRLCTFVRAESSPSTRILNGGESRQDDRFRQLAGALLSGLLPDADDTLAPPSPPRADLREDDPFDALLLSLLGVRTLWLEGDEERLVLCLALALSGSDRNEVGIDFDRPRAGLWLTPGSVVAGLSVGVALKAARWLAVVVAPFLSTSAETAARRMVEDLRTRGGVTSRHGPLPRLDALTAAERTSLGERKVLIVLLHGLFGTDLGTFDGFISQLHEATPARLQASLAQLASGAPPEQVRSQVGVAGVHEQLGRAAARGGDRVRQATGLEARAFIERHVGVVGWPHDSLAPIDTAATELAVLLTNAFGAGRPEHVVFVCHSQGGLLARAAAIELATMKAPAACWPQRIEAIATFGTPHRGAAIAEPGANGGREAAAFLMMLAGTGRPTALADLLTLLGERHLEGIEDVKAFNASTADRERAYVHGLLKAELGMAWPNGRHRPDLLVVGGRVGPTQKETWLRRAAAAFIARKLGDHEHDLVVELSSSTAPLLEPRASITIEADHLSYFSGEGGSAAALDVAVALVWSLLGDEVAGWEADLEAAAAPRKATMATFKLGPASGG